MKKPRKLMFPKDESSHDCIIEWWYFNGRLKDRKGNQYAFMDTFFKADSKKAKIPFLLKHPFKTSYFSHSILSDISAKKFYPRIDYVSIVSEASFSKKLFFVDYAHPVIVSGFVNKIMEQTGRSEYHIKTEDFDLRFKSVKKPLLENGNGFIDFKSKSADKSTYYYSLTNLETEGEVRINGKWIKVKGKSWMDHQWADSSYSPDDKWTWFSVQLEDNTDIVCFEFNDGKKSTYIATISDSKGRQVSAHDITLTSTGISWQSPLTKAKYPLSWKIEIPSKGISLETKPLLKKQEMVFGTINYWEGPLNIKGKINGKKVKGQGFMELVGYKKGVSEFRLLEKEVKNTARDVFDSALSFVKKEINSM